MTVREAADAYRLALQRTDATAARLITSAYQDQLRGIDLELRKLVAEMLLHPTLDYLAIRRLAAYQQLERRIETAMARLAESSSQAVLDGQTRAIDQALSAAQRLTLLQGADEWTPIERLAAVSITDSAEAIQLLRATWLAGADTTRGVLARAILAHTNPRQVAILINRAVGTPLPRALTIARTEILGASREASRQSYIMNRHLLTGWTWLSAMDDRTCPYCWSQTGTHHQVDDELVSHPSCRCTMVPDTGRLQMPNGVQRFGQLSATRQEKILGPKGYAAYKSGKVGLADFAGHRVDTRWGQVGYTRSVAAAEAAHSA